MGIIPFLYILYLLGVPALVMLLARRWRWIERVSPMAVLYVVGLLVANLLPQSDRLASIASTVSSICIPLSIPLMLVSCSLNGKAAGITLKAGVSGLIAILLVTVAGLFLFRGHTPPQQFAQVCAVAVGIYTGGIPNMGAIAQGVGMDAETYLYVTSYDLIVTGLYLVFVICLGKPFFRRLLPGDTTLPTNNTSKTISTSNTIPPQWITIPIALAVAVASYLLSTLFPPNLSTPLLILLLTTLSIGASFLPAVRRANRHAEQQGRQPLAFNVGLYFVYLFCFGIANACDVRTLDLTGSLNILWYILFVIFGSLLLQILFARLLHLDGDTTLVASAALINSPPFVPLVAALLDNKDLIARGIAIGLLGYLLGNYLGLGLFFLLK